jgi:hypothetical protein
MLQRRTTGIAIRALTADRMAGIRSRNKLQLKAAGHGAGDRSRTDDFDLGKVALYQLSYTRPAIDF